MRSGVERLPTPEPISSRISATINGSRAISRSALRCAWVRLSVARATPERKRVEL
ncbi:MAG: hypothetical protein ACLQFF_09935 [Steroidobacteraceae bacterium]